jgi:hypothetical protein
MKLILLFLLIATSVPVLSQVAKPTEPVQVPNFTRFEKARATGKIMQLVGTVGVFTYFLMEKKYNDRIDRGDMKAKRPSGVIPVVSTGFVGVGLTIDIAAGRHLRK